MSSCVAVNTSIRAVGAAAGLISLADVYRREIPSVIVKFRALFTVFYLLEVVQTAIYDVSSAVVDRLVGTPLNAVIWCMALYFLENFLSVFVSLERDMGSGLSKLLAGWKYARICIVITFVLMTIIFPFHSTNRLMLVRPTVAVICLAVVILPVCIAMFRLTHTLNVHRKSIQAQSREDESARVEEFAKRLRKVKITQVQLGLFGVVLLAVCLYASVTYIQEISDLAADIDYVWEKPPCDEGSGGIALAALVLSLVVTRSPHAPRRDRHNFSVTQMSVNSKARKASTPGHVASRRPTVSREPSVKSPDDENTTGPAAVAALTHAQGDTTPCETKDTHAAAKDDEGAKQRVSESEHSVAADCRGQV